jgi:hypothetical protein
MDRFLQLPGAPVSPPDNPSSIPSPVFETGNRLDNPRPQDASDPPRAVRDCFEVHEKKFKLQQTVPRGENFMGSPHVLPSFRNSNPSSKMALPTAAGSLDVKPVEPVAWPKMWPPTVTPVPASDRDESFAPRCSEKGCVFPASLDGSGKCVNHERQSKEPNLFSSFQPTRLVLDRAKFGVPEAEVDTSRAQDRRKLADIRQAFLED